MSELLIDRLGRDAERLPKAPAHAGLTNAQVWAASGAVASWLIAQGFGPGGERLAVQASASVQRGLLLLGALRAGALVVAGGARLVFGDQAGRPVGRSAGECVAFEALANCSIDAAVAERRLHIDARTPAREHAGRIERHGDLVTIAAALKLPWDD